MSYRLIGGLIVLSLFAVIVFASDDAPPALPTEYWGNVTINGVPASDGLEVIGLVNGVQYGNMPGGTINGQYNLLLSGGDRPLTYDNDRDCAVHWGNNEACVPCYNTSDCIEGPQDGAVIFIKVNSTTAMPSVSWLNGSSVYQVITVTTGSYNYTLILVPSWNLVSLPILPYDDRWSIIMAGCAYNKIWEFMPDQSWKSTQSGLERVNITKGYWIDRLGQSGNCSQTIEGIKQPDVFIPISGAWTLAGYPCIYSQSISIINNSLWDKIWEFMPDQSWKSTATGLSAFTSGKGYWIDGTTGGSYNVTCS